MRTLQFLLGLVLTSLPVHVVANTEKVVFVAPTAEPLPSDASIDNLLLTSFSEPFPSARTYINASFPTKDSEKGTETWFLLEQLQPGRRYEVRICWLATQPTSFWLHTHSIDHVFGNADLITSLSGYAYARHDQLSSEDIISLQARKPPKSTAAPTTTLFLQVFAMADYYSLDTDLMEHVPPVAVDVILDPFILNVLPRSLLPTGLWTRCF
ncbi:hypothetical protein B0A52_02497 [Exophiala mesophila]|uniref:Plastocyanin-like domain-containing protein n=1 Tax=Exophiala mesophila TaxID=212818 RepID=A0A438ND52_EXOME|nr:hypothetical protein B0A52_02497 [Exophiala mesophila]